MQSMSLRARFFIVCFLSLSAPVFATAQSVVSDEFNGSSLNTSLWTQLAPAGGNIAVSSGHVRLTVPGGSNHDAFVGGNNSVRVLQTVSDSNFDVAAKFDSALGKQYEGEGILVVQDSGTYMRLEYTSNGSALRLSAAFVSGGAQRQLSLVNAPSFNGSLWLQIQRNGTSWVFSSSTDGSTFQTAGAFTQSIRVTQIGLYAWNYNATPSASPALNAAVDYFHTVGSSPVPPVISNVTASPNLTGAAISWTTDVPSSSLVNYGTTTGYGGKVSNASLVTSHSLAITGLTCGTGYDYDVASTSSGNLTATSPNFTFTTSACSGGGGGGGPTSDNFDGATLNAGLWSFVNPLNDGRYAMTRSGVTLSIPTGTAHDPWTSVNNAVRLLQPIANTNFTVEARFQSDVEIGGQDEGIMVQQDATHFVRLDVLFNGQDVILFAGQVSGGSGTSFAYTPIAVSTAPIWLRLQRNANQWTGSWSTDGLTYHAAANFTASLNATAVGPFVGSASENNHIPAFTAICDYFFNTASRIANSDGPPPLAMVTVDANPGTPLVEKTLADIQGTGKLNPVIGLENPTDKLYWYAYPSSGGVSGSWTRHTVASSGSYYEDITPFDVNGDGAVDLIASYSADGSNYSIVWFENPRGHGVDPTTVSQWTMHNVGSGQGENTLLLADIDGDGKKDIVSPTKIYFQNSPTSWNQVPYANAFRGVTLLDIGSGHGNINLVTTGENSPYNVTWFENPRESGGNARTGTWITHNIGVQYACTSGTCGSGPDVATYNSADFNGDGRMDVVMGQSEGGSTGFPPGGMIWFEAPADRRNGTWIRHTIDSGFSYTHAIRVADMDANGTPDVITAEQDQSSFRRIAIFFNDGKGNFTEQILSNAGGHNATVGNIRGSGSLDILNSGHGFFGAPDPLQIFVNPRAH